MTETPDGMVRTAVPMGRSSEVLENLEKHRTALDALSPQDRLAWALNHFPGQFALTTSFGIQSAVLLHMLSELPSGRDTPVVWVDTGYLPPETYQYAATLTERLGIRLVVAQSETLCLCCAERPYPSFVRRPVCSK